MSLLFGPPRARRAHGQDTAVVRSDPVLDDLLRRREAVMDTGELVDLDTAGRHSAVFACVDLIARLVSTLPVDEFDRQGPDGALRHLPTPPLLISPDGELDVTAWLYQAVDSLLKRGNVFGLITGYNAQGWPTRVELQHPDCVGYRAPSDRGPAEWTINGRPVGKWPSGDLWHLSAYTFAGCPVGVSPIAFAAMTIGVGLASQRFAAQWFRDGMVPTALLTNEAEVPPALADLVKSMWRTALSGNREPVVLGDGWHYEQVSVRPEESQFLDTIQANKADVCMFFGVDPEAIGAVRSGGSSVVYQNVEQSHIHLLVRTVQPWIVRLERALTALRPRPRFVKLNPDAILRVDAKTRVQVNDIQVRGGTLTPDEVRELEDRPPLPDGMGRRALWPPGRMQLDNHEVQLGADTDPATEPLPPAAAAPTSDNASPGSVPAVTDNDGDG